MDKKALRILYKEKRAALNKQERADYSVAIANNCLALDIWNHTNFHIFLSIEKLLEIDTQPLIHILMARDKNIMVPRSDFKTNTLEHIVLTDATVFKETPHGIIEPVNGLLVNASNIEVVFIPLLAYDKQGNRVGYGKGFYDRFLTETKPDALKIGLSFFEPTTNLIQVRSNDIALDYVVTPFGTYQF